MSNSKLTSMEEQVKKIVLNEGAVLVGICSTESIMDKECSNTNYLLPGAQSIISIAINYSEEAVKRYLAKETQELLSIEEGTITKRLKAIGEKIKDFLENKGHKAVNCDINFDYRFVQRSKLDVIGNLRTMIDLINKEKDKKGQLTEKEQKMLRLLKKAILNALRKTPMDLMPEMSHRRAAVAAGIGRIGWSGNIITEKFGARVLLNSIITDAKLKPDKPLEKNPCIGCKLCEKSCQGGLFAKDEKQTITIAGVQETIAKRNSYAYCIAVCSGMIGQNKFDNWSTWSPFRLDNGEKLPLDDSVIEYVQNMFPKAVEKGGEEAENVFRLTENSYIGLNDKKIEDFISTCGFCQLVCGPTIKDKKESYKSIVDSGCVE